MTEAVWRPIADFPGYEVSSAGEVRSWLVDPRQRGAALPRILAGGHNQDGYRRVVLYRKPRVRKSVTVHHLVLGAFGPPRPSPDHVARHLDGNKLNNAIENLAWGTQKENIDDRGRHGTTRVKLTDDQVRAIAAAKSSGRSMRQVAAEYGITMGYVWEIQSRHSRRARALLGAA